MSTAQDRNAAAIFRAAEFAGIDGHVGEDIFSAARKAELMERIYERGDRLVAIFITLHALTALALAAFYQTWLVTGVVTFCAVAMFAVSVALLPRSFITRCVAGVSLQTFVALHIYQLHGMAEMHFFFFTAFTMLIVYQDWKCMWPGAIGLIGQHLAFALMHNAGWGAGLFFFEESYVGITKLFFHFAIALGQVGICGYWAYLLHRQTLASAAQNAGLHALGEEVRHSESKFRALIEHALDIITIVDAEGIIRYESPAVARVLGYQPEELVGQPVFAFIHPDDLPTLRAGFARRQNAAEAESEPFEFRYRHRNGSWRILQAVASVMDAAVGGMVINSRDVTERRRAEHEAKRRAGQQVATSEFAREALAGKEINELFASAVGLVTRSLEVEFAYIGELLEDEQNLLVRAQTDFPDGRREHLIPAGPRSYGGYTLLSAEPTVVEDFAVESRFEPTLLSRQQGVRSGLSVVIEGRERVFGVLVAKSMEPGRFTKDDIAFVSAIADILSSALDRQRAQEGLHAAKEEAERANNAKSEFLSRMSHELRTPLNAILGFGQILEMSDLAAKAKEGLTHIMRAGRHLLSLIDEVLAIARIEAGRLSLSLEPVAVSEIVQECLSLVSRQAASAGIQCENLCAAAQGCHEYVQADRQRLRQVLLNLLSNAIKYNREKGQVTVSLRRLPEAPAQASARGGEDGPPDDAQWLRLEISDTGHGLANDEISRLFIPFERLSAEHSSVEGTGLGLALSKGLVEVMGGYIGVESKEGEGSKFWLDLPMALDPVSQMGAQMEPMGLPGIGSPEKGTVLYIEDNLSNLRLIEMLLEERPDCDLLSAQQGMLGLELAQSRRPDLILLDLHLPDIPGWDVLARLQADKRLRDIPVVVISADATPKQIERLLKLGAREYLTKPIDVVKLMRALNEHLSQRESALAVSA